MLILEGAQAGLSWMTILKKRENFRNALDGFDPLCISRYGEEKIHELLEDRGIIRNRLKITAVIAMHGPFSTFRRNSAVSTFTSGSSSITNRSETDGNGSPISRPGPKRRRP